MSVQYINDADGKPAFVVIPYAEFLRSNSAALTESEASASHSLLSADGRSIRLPHGGPGANIDLLQFIEAWMRRGTISLAISKRQQAYGKFQGELLNGLDAIVRRCFLSEDSPYKNTMQTTTDVIDAFVETGVFSRSLESMPGYYRPVQCIRINQEKAWEFLKKHGQPNNPLDMSRFMLPLP